jgi:hypothetical protein
MNLELMNTKDRIKEHQKYEHLDDAPIPITICYGERMTIQTLKPYLLMMQPSNMQDFPKTYI